jgi:hypothetical protein
VYYIPVCMALVLHASPIIFVLFRGLPPSADLERERAREIRVRGTLECNKRIIFHSTNPHKISILFLVVVVVVVATTNPLATKTTTNHEDHNVDNMVFTSFVPPTQVLPNAEP